MEAVLEQPKKERIYDIVGKRMNPAQIQKSWPYILAAIAQSITKPMDEDMALNLHTAIVTGDMQCWGLMTKRPQGFRYVGLLTTQVTTDTMRRERSLLIYSFYCGVPVQKEAWVREFAKLEEFAKEQNCARISAQTDNPRVLEIVKEIGFGEPKTLIAKEL